MQESQLQRLVGVMDTLRSPGGCPWDAEQTHESLLKYLLEESYEFVDAVHAGNRVDMREELGDVLLIRLVELGGRVDGLAVLALRIAFFVERVKSVLHVLKKRIGMRITLRQCKAHVGAI